jgi:hypothetical protein
VGIDAKIPLIKGKGGFEEGGSFLPRQRLGGKELIMGTKGRKNVKKPKQQKDKKEKKK